MWLRGEVRGCTRKYGAGKTDTFCHCQTDCKSACGWGLESVCVSMCVFVFCICMCQGENERGKKSNGSV